MGIFERSEREEAAGLWTLTPLEDTEGAGSEVPIDPDRGREKLFRFRMMGRTAAENSRGWPGEPLGSRNSDAPLERVRVVKWGRAIFGLADLVLNPPVSEGTKCTTSGWTRHREAPTIASLIDTHTGAVHPFRSLMKLNEFRSSISTQCPWSILHR